MARKRDYWNRKAIFETGADYMLVFGQNCAGKSYQGKLECIERWKNGERFYFLRRWQSDINQNIATSYFDDMPISQLTNGEWDDVEARSGEYYFTRLNSEGIKERSDCIGYYGDLNEWQRYKSRVFINCTFILFEEYITDGIYLDDEPEKLFRLRTTIFRDKPGKVLMLGNSISRIVPYHTEWSLDGIPKMQQGTIELYHMTDMDDENKEVLIAVEFGGKLKGTGSGFFGESAKTIVSGEWDVKNYPRLPKDHIDYEKVYEMVIEYQSFKFVLELLVDPEEGTKVVFVYPKTTDRKIERVITERFSTDMYTSRYFRDNRPEQYIQECIGSERICYSDNLTATDFNGVLAQMDL